MSTILDTLKEKFQAAELSLNGSVPEKLHKLRKEAMDKVLQDGLPDRKSEAYKYTDLSKTLKRFDSAPLLESAGALKEFPEALISGDNLNYLTFINGRFRGELSRVVSPAEELEVRPLADVLENDEAFFSKYYGQLADADKDAFVGLNSAFSAGGVLIHIKKNARPAAVVIRHIADNSAGEGITYSRNLCIAERFSESVITEQFSGTADHEYFRNSLSEVFVDVNAKVQWHKMQNDVAASQIDQMEVHQENASRFDLTTLTTEGKLIRNNVRIAVDGEGCETHLYGLYLINGKTHVDNQTSVDHIKPHSESNELYKGVLDERAHGVFNGKVYVRQEAQKTNAFQSNKNILLSDNATVNTKPQLEIWADDVKCSHGCTTGQLDDEALFYLRSRGLSEASARRLMLLAFAIDTMHGIDHEEIKSVFEQEVTRKLDS